MAIINVRSPHVRAIQRSHADAVNVVRNILARDIPKTEDGTPVVNPLPVSVRVLTAFFVILGVLVIGIVTWRIVVWKRRKALPASQKYRQGNFSPSEKIRPIGEGRPMEKQEVLVVLPIEPPPSVKLSDGKWKPQVIHGSDNDTKWKPQMFNNNGPNVLDVKAPLPKEPIMSPPPTYTATHSPASTPSSSPRPPALNLPAVSVTHDDSNHLSVPLQTPVPSPRRTSSFGTEGFGEQANLKAKPSMKGQKLPRRMLVEHTFVPTLADELAIKVGDVLNMLEEYEDEWCLVERVGSRSGERGVVPRFCLKERPRGHKRGQSSTASSVKSTRQQ